MQGIIGKKIGMTRIFDKDSGRAIPVTIIQGNDNVVHQVKTVEKDGYRAVQLGFGPLAERKVGKPFAGHCKKHGSTPTRHVKEFAFDNEEESIEPGSKVGVDMFDEVTSVDITGVSKGRGYAGTIKRHNFQRGRETHGNTNHRERGSLGPGTYPARVFPGLTMAGQYGAAQVTAKNLEVVSVDKEAGVLLVKGAVPGANRGIVYIYKSPAN